MEPRGLKDIPLPYEVEENCQHQNNNAPYHYGHYGANNLPAMFRNLKVEDLILLFLIILLLAEGSDCDYLLVGILVVIFLAGFDGNPFGIL
jgi:hypothetical protein